MTKDSENIEKGLNFVAKSSVIVFIGILISKIFLYIYRVVIARYFGPEPYGLFSLAMMILMIFVAIASFGLPEGAVRFISLYRGKNQHNRIRHVFRKFSILLLISGIVFAVILFLLAGVISNNLFKDPDMIIFLKIASFIIPFYVLANFFLSFIRAFEKIGTYSFIINIMQNVIKVVAIVILIIFGMKSNSIMASYFLGIFVMFILAYSYCMYRLQTAHKSYQLDKQERKKVKKEMFIYSVPLMFTSILITAYYWIDSFMIGLLNVGNAGIYSVGLYNAALPIALLFTIAPDFFIQAFYPLITKEYAKKNLNSIKEMSKQVAKWIFIINLPLFMIMFIFPGTIINILFGQEYLSALIALRILSIGGILSSLVALLSSILLMKGKSKIILFNFILTSVTNIILDIILIPKFGINGAAIATTLVWILLSIVLFIEVKKTAGFIPLRRKMLGIFIISLVPTFLLLAIKPFFKINIFTLILLGIFFLLVYLILLLTTRSFDKNDLFILKNFKNKLSSSIVSKIEKFFQ